MDLKNRSKKELLNEIEKLKNELDTIKSSGSPDSNSTAKSFEYRKAIQNSRILSRAVEQSPLSIVITDVEGNIEYANPSAVVLTGYVKEDLIGRNPKILKSGLTPDSEFKNMWETISSGKVWEGMFHNKRKNGEIFIEKAIVSPVIDDNGEVTNYIALKEDITRQIKNEKDALLFRTIAEQASYGTAVTDLEGVILFVNDAMARMHGYEASELTNQKLSVFHNQYQIDGVLELVHELVEKGSFVSREVWHTHKSGNVFPTLMSASTLYDKAGFPLYLLASAIDISEMKRTEDALKNSEMKLNYAQQVARMGSWEIEMESDRFYWSDNCYRILGMEPQQPGVKNDDFRNLIHPDDKVILDEMFTFCTRNRMPINRDMRIILPDGTLKWISNFIVPAIVHKRLVGLSGVIVDITEKKIIEDSIKKSEADLKYAQRIARMGSWEYEFLTGKYSWSENNYSLLGVPMDTKVTVEYFREMVYPDDLKLLDSQIEYLLENKCSVTMDIRLVLQSGEFAWIQNDIIPVLDNDIIIAIKGVCIDITERKKSQQEILELNIGLEKKVTERTAELESINFSLNEEIRERKRVEDALAKSEYQYRSVVENINEIIFRTDIHGNLIFLNKAWENVTLFMLADSIGRSLFNYVTEEDRQQITGLFKLLLKREKQFFRKEIRFMTKSGGFCWLEVYAKPALDAEGMINGIYGTLQDVTERKLGEDFEKEMLLLSAQLTAIDSQKINNSLNMALERIGKFLNADRSYIFEFNYCNNTMSNTYEWCNVGINPEIDNLQEIEMNLFQEWMRRFNNHEEVVIEDVSKLTGSRKSEREILEPQCVRSLVTLPLYNEDQLIGFVGIDSVKKERIYTGTEINILRIWSGMLASMINNLRNESLLELARQNFEIFFNTIDEFLWVIDSSGNIIHFNKTVSERLGYSEEDLINKPVVMVHPENSRSEALEIIGDMLKGSEVSCNLPLISKSGQLVPVETKVKHGYWNGRPAIFGVSKDFTQIQLSEQKFSTAFKANSALMAITNPDTNLFVDVNNAFLSTLEYTREEVIGFSNAELKIFDEDDLSLKIKDCTDNGRPVKDIEIVLRSKTGKKLTILLTSELINIGSENCILTVAVNITERKLAEDLLQRNKSLLEMMSNSSPFGYLLVDNEKDTILYFNSQFCRIWEVDDLEVPMSRGEVPNSVLLNRCIDNLESPEQIKQTIGKLRIASNREVVSDELRLKSGKIIHRYTTQLLTGEDMYYGRFYIFEDITENKLRETELWNARKEAEMANSAKSEFLSRMSHELRTPLNSILGFAQLLELSNPSPIQIKGITHILHSGKHLLDLINEVLDISRIESGRIKTSPEIIELRPLLDEMFDIIKPIAMSANISFVCNIPEDAPISIWVDKQRIKQVLLNLLNNAVKYNRQDGSIVINAIYTTTDSGRSMARVEVVDTGFGIAPDDLSKIFTPFERAGAAHTDIEGTGLGLSVSKKMIEAMDGRIGVESEKGVGSTFWIEVPLATVESNNLNKIK